MMKSVFGAGALTMFALLHWTGCSGDAEPASDPPDATPDDQRRPDSGPKPEAEPEPEALPSRLRVIAETLDPLLTCPFRIWDKFSWAKAQMLFYSMKEKTAFLWNGQKRGDGKMHAVDFATLPQEELFAIFNFIDYEGADTVAVSLDDTKMRYYADFANELAIHEGFHRWAQPSWTGYVPGDGEANARDPDYPDDHRLRYLRWQLIKSLLRGVHAKSNAEALGGASYWLGVLYTEYPTRMSALRGTDIDEGTAQYATLSAHILGKFGCDVPEEKIVAEFERYADQFVSNAIDPLTSGYEPYDIGLLAGMTLRRNGAASYVDKVASGTSLADVLLSAVPAVEQVDDPADLEFAKNKVEAENAEAAAWIEPLMARLKDPAATRLVFPGMWMSGTFMMGGQSYYVATEPERPHVLPEVTTVLEDSTSHSTVALHDLDLVMDMKSPCDTEFPTIAPFVAGEISFDSASGKATSNSGALQNKPLSVTQKTDENGVVWLCVTGI